MADETNAEKLTLGDAIKDLGWFFGLFTLVVGSPSILQIHQHAVSSFELVPLLQWIPEGWSQLMSVMASYIEPLVQPAIDWANARFGWSLTLNPVWRPLFALCMVLELAFLRAVIRQGDVVGALRGGGAFTIGSFAAALLIGLFAAGPGWLAQGAVAVVPIAMFGMVAAAMSAARGNWRQLPSTFAAFGILTLVFFPIGAGLSFAPGLAQSGGLFALGLAIAGIGAGQVRQGLRAGNRFDTRTGLTMLGGFVSAAFILLADFALKAIDAAGREGHTAISGDLPSLAARTQPDDWTEATLPDAEADYRNRPGPKLPTGTHLRAA